MQSPGGERHSGLKDRVAIHSVRLDTAPAPDALALLSQEERLRHAAFGAPATGVRFALMRIALRQMLGNALGLPPSAVLLDTTASGKPLLSAAPNAPDIRFNISHTEGLGLIAVTLGRDVGIDVELARPCDALGIARRYFAPDETLRLEALDPAARTSAFFDSWVALEAVVKAAGLSITGGFNPLTKHPACTVLALNVPPGYHAAIAAMGTRPFEIEWHSLPSAPGTPVC